MWPKVDVEIKKSWVTWKDAIFSVEKNMMVNLGITFKVMKLCVMFDLTNKIMLQFAIEYNRKGIEETELKGANGDLNQVALL